jgi:hypothetical protein
MYIQNNTAIKARPKMKGKDVTSEGISLRLIILMVVYQKWTNKNPFHNRPFLTKIVLPKTVTG